MLGTLVYTSIGTSFTGTLLSLVVVTVIFELATRGCKVTGVEPEDAGVGDDGCFKVERGEGAKCTSL